MAVPKRKISKQRGNTRFAHWKKTAPTLSACPQCHELKAAHQACSKCGYYDGKPAVDIKAKKDKD
ncbi:MAG: 50S ribosomal protein L32 [Clostridiales bacterium]|jgi:large subunit ribosomal protein L32|nr:50S ribosomal protein L32 [Clostridiales bacterium]